MGLLHHIPLLAGSLAAGGMYSREVCYRSEVSLIALLEHRYSSPEMVNIYKMQKFLFVSVCVCVCVCVSAFSL